MAALRLLTVLALICAAGQGMATVPDAVLRALGLPDRQNAASILGAIQTDLAWISLLRAPVTGRPDPQTSEAIRDFQLSLGHSSSGQLSDDQRNELAQRAIGTRNGFGFQRRRFDWVGMALELPQALMSVPEVTGDDLAGLFLRADGGLSLKIELDALTGGIDPTAYVAAYRSDLEKEDDDATVHAHGTIEGFGFLDMSSEGIRHLVVMQSRQGETRKIIISFPEATHTALRPLLTRMISSLVLFDGPRPDTAERRRRVALGDYPGARDVPAWFHTMIANGSGSIVSREGHVLTNEHVVSTCGRLTVNGQPAILVGADVRLDLALIRVPGLADRIPIRFRETNPGLGEVAGVMGYPIFSTSQSLNFTTGIVSSTVGYRGDRTRIQLTTPIQPGNSGGPVIDTNGAQMAVVVAKASSGLRENNNVENVGWAVRGRQALGFLRLYRVTPLIERRAPGPQLPGADVVSDWRQYVVRIECHRK